MRLSACLLATFVLGCGGPASSASNWDMGAGGDEGGFEAVAPLPDSASPPDGATPEAAPITTTTDAAGSDSGHPTVDAARDALSDAAADGEAGTSTAFCCQQTCTTPAVSCADHDVSCGADGGPVLDAGCLFHATVLCRGTIVLCM